MAGRVEYGDAELAVRVDVRMVERAEELEVCFSVSRPLVHGDVLYDWSALPGGEYG